jgi:hypothetical protein
MDDRRRLGGLRLIGRYSDTAALFQALGGGWSNRADLAENRSG